MCLANSPSHASPCNHVEVVQRPRDVFELEVILDLDHDGVQDDERESPVLDGPTVCFILAWHDQNNNQTGTGHSPKDRRLIASSSIAESPSFVLMTPAKQLQCCC